MDQAFTFRLVNLSRPNLLAAPPSLAPDGTLTFSPAPDMFGNCTATFDLRDDGGTFRGGQDTSAAHSIVIIIVPVNHPPSFSLMMRTVVVDVVLNATIYSFPNFVSNVLPGPANENCNVSTPTCQAQKVIMVTYDVINPFLFQLFPAIDSSGTLNVVPYPGASGISTILVGAQDDGGTADGGRNVSTTQSFDIIVHSNSNPDFVLPWIVSCVASPPFRNGTQLSGTSAALQSSSVASVALRDEELQEIAAACTCPIVVNQSAGPQNQDQWATNGCAVRSLDAVSVTVRENSGPINISGFAAEVTPTEGYLSATIAVFIENASVLTLRDIRQDPNITFSGKVFPGLEYMTDYAISPDGLHMYSVEYITNTISTFQLQGDDSPFPSGFLDRRADGEQRMRFEEAPAAADLIAQAVCDLEPFGWNGSTYIAVAAGCAYLKDYEESVAEIVPFCGDSQFITSCGLWNATVAFWELSERFLSEAGQLDGFSEAIPLGCNWTMCLYDLNGTVIGSASFVDLTNNSGSAYLYGPVKNSTDFDPEADVATMETFLMNNGKYEAFQFNREGPSWNRGLIVTDDAFTLADPARSQMPLPSKVMSVEVWFAVQNLTGNAFAGLAGTVGADSTCPIGWALDYQQSGSAESWLPTNFRFRIAFSANASNFTSVQAADPSPVFLAGGQNPATVSHPVSWKHLVATYDGASLRLFLDGVIQVSKECSRCGDIVYRHSSSTNCSSQYAPFVLGRAVDGLSHSGPISSVRIFNANLTEEQVAALRKERVAGLTEISQQYYWVRGVGHDIFGGLSSPSGDYAAMNSPSKVAVRGRFDNSKSYKASFVNSAGIELFQSPGKTADDDFTFTFNTPVWSYGPEAPRLAVLEQNSLGYYRPLWQKTCLHSPCWDLRLCELSSDSQCLASPLQASDSRKVRGLSGAFVRFRFLDQARILRVDAAGTLVDSPYGLSTIDCGSNANCIFARQTCQGAGSALDGRLCAGDADCNGTCGITSPVGATGASQATHFESDGRHFIFVSNYWDGVSVDTYSSLYALDSATGATLVQSIQTRAARGAAFFNIPIDQSSAKPFLAIANFASGAVAIYPWFDDPSLYPESSGLPLADGLRVDLAAVGSSAVVPFMLDGTSMLLIASADSRKGASVVYRLGLPINETYSRFGGAVEPHASEFIGKSLAAALFQELGEARSVTDALHFETVDGNHYLVFIVLSPQRPSLLYKYSPGEKRFVPQQEIPTSNATAAALIEVPAGRFLAVAQGGGDLLVLRWNGSAFLGSVDISTAAADVAGGQRLTSASYILSVAAIPVDSVTGNEAQQDELLVAGSYASFSLADPAIYTAPSAAFRSQLDSVVGLQGPAAVQLSGDGRRLYVAAAESATIVAFDRDAVTGRLHFNATAGYSPALQFSTGAQIAPGCTNQSALLGCPLRGVQAITFADGGRRLYAVAYVDGAVVVFDVGPTGLHLAQTVLQGLPTTPGGPPVYGLLGARGLTLSPDQRSLYVAGALDHAVVRFDRNPSSSALVYVGRIKAGERLVRTFRDLSQMLDVCSLEPLSDTAYSALSEITFATLIAQLGEADSRAAQLDSDPTLPVNLPYPADLSCMMQWDGTRYKEPTTWPMVAQAAAAFRVGESALLAVVFSTGYGMRGSGGLLLYGWDIEGNRVLLLQNISEPGASSQAVAYFNLTDDDGAVDHYIAEVRVGAGILVYRWVNASSGNLLLHHRLPLSQSCGPVAAILAWQHLGVNFLGVACGGASCGAIVFRWNGEGSFFFNGELTWGTGFDTFQVLSNCTTGLAFLSPGLLVLGGPGGIAALRFIPDAFNEALSAPVGAYVPTVPPLMIPGIASLAGINIPGLKPLLAVACGPGTPSVILRLANDGSNSFQILQEDLPDSVASIRAFYSDGETYIAVARSPCSQGSNCTCDTLSAVDSVPSAILQYNRVRGVFGPILALTDSDNLALRGVPVPEGDFETHAQPLNLTAGAALAFEPFDTGDGAQFLLLITLACYPATGPPLPALDSRPVWNGAVLLRWNISRVDGLLGAAAVAASPGGAVFVAAALDGRVSTWRFNGTAKPELLGLYPPSGQLPGIRGVRNFVSIPSRKVNATSTAQPIAASDPAMAYVFPSAPVNGSLLLLRMGLDYSQRLCAPFPPLPPRLNGTASSFAGCQALTFVVEPVETDNSALFVSPPALDVAGNLAFQPRRAQVC